LGYLLDGVVLEIDAVEVVGLGHVVYESVQEELYEAFFIYFVYLLFVWIQNFETTTTNTNTNTKKIGRKEMYFEERI